MPLHDIYGLGESPGGVFENSITGEFRTPIISERQRIEYIRHGEDLIPLSVRQGPVKTTFSPLDYKNENSYLNQPVIAMQRVRLFDVGSPMDPQAIPRDEEFYAYIVGTNSTKQYLLLDAIAFDGKVMTPVPVSINRLRLIGEPIVGQELKAILKDAPKDRESVFKGVPEALYNPRERRQPRDDQIQKVA